MVIADERTTAQEQDRRATEILERAWEEPDPAEAARLRDEVVMGNQGLAIGLVRRFEGRGIEHEDLVQVAMLGLVQAARRYRPGRGHGFTAFAAPTITGELKRYFRDHGWAVRPPRSLQEQYQDVRSIARELAQDLQREPTTVEIARVMGASEEDVQEALQAGHQYRAASLDTPVRGASERPLGDTLADEQEDPYDKVVTLVSLRAAMEDLDSRDRLILKLRYSADMSQTQIGQRIGVSQMQVSRLLSSICTRLRARIDGEANDADATTPGGRLTAS